MAVFLALTGVLTARPQPGFDPHPEFREDGKARWERFLRERGFIER